MALLLTRNGTHHKPRAVSRAILAGKRTARTAMHLVPERASLPLRVRVPLTIALPAYAIPGAPDGGWNEFWTGVALAMLLFPSVRRRTLTVWRGCWVTAGAEMGPEPEYCGWCAARWEAKQARARKRDARRGLPASWRARLTARDLAAAIRRAPGMARAEVTELARAVRAELGARFTRNGRR